MKINKKLVTNSDKKQWENITLEQFNLIQEAMHIEDETERVLELVSIIFGEDTLDLPVAEFQQKVKQLSFLSEKVPEVATKKKYTLNGKTYSLAADLTRMTASQYVDFTNLAKDGKLNQQIAVFLIPEGKTYNEGYDIEEVFKDALQMSIVDAQALAFLFKRQLLAFITLFQHYSIKAIKKLKLEKSLENEMIARIKDQTILTESLLIS